MVARPPGLAGLDQGCNTCRKALVQVSQARLPGSSCPQQAQASANIAAPGLRCERQRCWSPARRLVWGRPG